VEIGREGTVGF